MPNDAKDPDQVYKHHEDGSVERLVFEKTEDLLFDGDKMQSTLQRDIAHARLQLAITQAMCAYIEETNVSERVGLTQIDFEHHGARVSVRVEIGEMPITNISKDGDSTFPIIRQFATMQALAGDGEICKAGCQCGRNRERDIQAVENTLRQDLEKMSSEVPSSNWRPNSMYTSREDQQVYGG